MKEYSRYKNNVVAAAGKCFWAGLLDYGLIFVLSFLLMWVVGIPIFSALPSTIENGKAMEASQKETTSIISATHLQLYGDDLEIMDAFKMGDRYLQTLAKTSYYLHEESYPSKDGAVKVEEKDTFLNFGTEEEPYPNDSLSYYFLFFKEEAGQGIGEFVYNGVDYSSDKEGYLYEVAMGYEDLSHFEEIDGRLPLYQSIKLEEARLLADYFVYGDQSDNVLGTYYYYRNAYVRASDVFVSEVQTKYAPYLEANASLVNATRNYYSTMILVFSLCLVLGFGLLEGLPPIFFKNGKTIGIKSFRLGYSTVEETEPEWWRFLVKSLVRLPIHFSSIGLSLYFLSSGALGLLFLNLGGGFSLAYLVFASLLLGLGSTILSLARKEHQGLAEAVAGLLVKDTEVSEAGTPLEERGVSGGRQ